MRGRPVPSREDLSGDDEGGGVGAEILEEIRQAIQEHKRLLGTITRGELIISKAHDDEEDGEDDEAHELDGFAAPGVDEEEGDPVPWDETCGGEDEISDTDVVQIVVDGADTL